MIAHRVRNGRTLYLVKWQGLGYSEATWEDGERDLADDRVSRGQPVVDRWQLGAGLVTPLAAGVSCALSGPRAWRPGLA